MRFIEYMPFDGNKWSQNKFVPYRSMLAQILTRWPDLTRRTDDPNHTAKVWDYICAVWHWHRKMAWARGATTITHTMQVL